MIENAEKLGRLILWLALTSLCILYPMAIREQTRETMRLAEAAKNEALAASDKAREETKVEQATKMRRLEFSLMGPALRWASGTTGNVLFSNTTSLSGYVCLQGTASKNGESAQTVPACIRVEPFGSNLKLELAFGGGMFKICPANDCLFEVKDVPMAAAAP